MVLLFSPGFCAETEKSVKKRSDAVEDETVESPIAYVIDDQESQDGDNYTSPEEIVVVPLSTTTTTTPVPEESNVASSQVEELVSTGPVVQHEIKGESSDLEPANTLLYGYDYQQHYHHQPIPVPIQLDSYKVDYVKPVAYHGYHHFYKPTYRTSHYNKLFRLGPFGINVKIGSHYFRHPHHGFRKEFYKHFHLFG